MLDKKLVDAELKSIFSNMGQMYNKKLVEGELNNIFQLILASLDPEYLVQLTNQKIADGKFGMDSKQFQKSNWNRVIPALVEENNKKNKGKEEIKIIPANFDFYDHIYKRLVGGGESRAEAEDGTNKILYKIFLPEISAKLDREVKEEISEDGELSTKRDEKGSSPAELQDILEESKSDLINHVRRMIDSKKVDENYNFTIAFKNIAKKKTDDWFRQITNLRKKEVQPKNKSDESTSIDDKEDTKIETSEEMFSKQFEEQMEDDKIDDAVLAVLGGKLKDDLQEFIDEEKKDGLISSNAVKVIEFFIDVYVPGKDKKKNENEEQCRRRAVLKELKLIPEEIEEKDKLDDVVQKAIKEYNKIVEEVRYALVRYAYQYDNETMLHSLKNKGTSGAKFPQDANAHFNPTQKKFVKKDLEKITKFLDDNYDKGYATIKKEFEKWFPKKLVGELTDIYEEQGSVEKMLDFIEKYKSTGKSLSDYEGKKKKSSARIAAVVSYLEELMGRL